MLYFDLDKQGVFTVFERKKVKFIHINSGKKEEIIY